ncbi:TonB box [Echinococcus multilocularis]|uniref:TonB box n=1 Tax=Echinococcus multilocularis TaxID=6211 RepID=A0A068Y7R0_ECHMU|nr:TonB box [Echinococcus multilocularis]
MHTDTGVAKPPKSPSFEGKFTMSVRGEHRSFWFTDFWRSSRRKSILLSQQGYTQKARFSFYGRAVAARCDASTLPLVFSSVITRLTLDQTPRREVIPGSRRQGTISGFPYLIGWS